MIICEKKTQNSSRPIIGIQWLCSFLVILFSIYDLLIHLIVQVSKLSINIYSRFHFTLHIQSPSFVDGPIYIYLKYIHLLRSSLVCPKLRPSTFPDCFSNLSLSQNPLVFLYSVSFSSSPQNPKS